MRTRKCKCGTRFAVNGPGGTARLCSKCRNLSRTKRNQNFYDRMRAAQAIQRSGSGVGILDHVAEAQILGQIP